MRFSIIRTTLRRAAYICSDISRNGIRHSTTLYITAVPKHLLTSAKQSFASLMCPYRQSTDRRIILSLCATIIDRVTLQFYYRLINKYWFTMKYVTSILSIFYYILLPLFRFFVFYIRVITKIIIFSTEDIKSVFI